MNNSIIEEVGELIQLFKSYVPKGNELWLKEKENIKSEEDLISFLILLFKHEEREIAKTREAAYVTDIYENGVRSFAAVLVRKLVKFHEVLSIISTYIDLMSQKHMAYALYHSLDKGSLETTSILQNSDYKIRLYEGLTNFYRDFYGSFSDNEEAIRLLCKNYPQNINDRLSYEENIVDALYLHITSAGTPDDRGYAFRGIDQIRQYIDKLPVSIIRKLLKQYRLYDVLNQKVYRHQIFTIIKWSAIEDVEKPTLKFFYLDSLVIANLFNFEWISVKERSREKFKMHYNSYEEKLIDKRIRVLDEPDSFWSNDCGNKRQFVENGQEMASIVLQENEIIVVSYKDNKTKFFFDNNEWEFGSYRTKNITEKIYNLLLDKDEENKRLNYKQMKFSLLFLDQYRGMEAQTLDFDHKFTYEMESKKLTSRPIDEDCIPHFYGKAVYSLSCIVGKNGTGKTSAVDFMRDTFFKLLKVLQDFDVPCENGCVEENLYINAVLHKDTKFLAVFHFGEKDYFLTNIKDVQFSGVEPYRKGICQNVDEFCKIAYFSPQLRTDQSELFGERGKDIGNQKKHGVSKALDGLRQCDYSEAKSFMSSINTLMPLSVSETTNQKQDRSVINRELCYQFSLLRNLQGEDICKYLNISDKREFILYDLASGEHLKVFSLDDCHDSSKIDNFVKDYATNPNVRIGFFSSGEYAKFVFLAKMYWFLKGCRDDAEYYKKGLEIDYFSREDALQEGETALIFIDEGELYYHPEWQRQYLATLLDMFHKCQIDSLLQVVFTTNSPFVISDVLRADVQYLSDRPEELGNTLGQNIHSLLKNNFFMNYTIGEYSRELINRIIRWMAEENPDSEEQEVDFTCYFDDIKDEYKAVGLLIQQIGEPVYRKKLEMMLEEKMIRESLVERQIRELEKQKAEVEAKIARLKVGDRM